jgi:hypothetical protein
MQKIKVAKVESKTVKNGGTMVIVTDDKGAKFSGFHKSLQDIRGGDTINAEIQVEGQYNNIMSFEFLERASGGAGPVPGPDRGHTSGGISDQTRLTISRLERISIEGQNALGHLTNFLITPGLQVKTEERDELFQLFKRATKAKIEGYLATGENGKASPAVAPGPASPAKQPPTPTKALPQVAAPLKPNVAEKKPLTAEELLKMTHANPGEFYTACFKQFNMPKTLVDQEIPEYDLTKPNQRKDAWEVIVKSHGPVPEEELFKEKVA